MEIYNLDLKKVKKDRYNILGNIKNVENVIALKTKKSLFSLYILYDTNSYYIKLPKKTFTQEELNKYMK